jgi:YHS domain-containing protein
MRRSVLAIALVMAIASPAFAGDTVVGDPYPLDKCPLSGKALTADAVVVVKDGREFKFCCNDCKGKFESDPAAVIGKADAAILEKEKASYPLDTCVMSGEKLGDKAVDAVINNRLVRFCCADCVGDFKKDVAGNLAKLDAAVIAKEKGSYTAKTCPVSGEELGKMGEPHTVVIANQMVSLCCKSCEKKLRAEPAKYLAMVSGGEAAEKPAEKK